MLKHEQRDFITHADGLFSSEKLRSIMEHFGLVSEQQTEPDTLSERDKNCLRLGQATDLMRKQERWYDIWRQSGKDLENLLEIIGPFRFVTYPVQMRQVKSKNHYVPWHQDIGYMRLLPKQHKQVITCFVPLEEYPSKTTTILFMPTEKPCVLEHQPKQGFGAGLPLDDENIEASKYFELNLGDALVFGDLAIHKTYTPPNCRVERSSLEFRLVKAEHRIEGKDYFDIENGRFINFSPKND